MTVQEVLDNIKQSKSNDTSYKTKSKKDEVKVMRSILNDKNYEVSVYGPNGIEGIYNPSLSTRKAISSILQNAVHISKQESDLIMNSYEFNNLEASEFVNLGKEFINTYLDTGRKVCLGGRERSDISFYKRTIPSYSIKSPIPKKNSDGSINYNDTIVTNVAEYDTIKIASRCPKWLKTN